MLVIEFVDLDVAIVTSNMIVEIYCLMHELPQGAIFELASVNLKGHLKALCAPLQLCMHSICSL